MKWVKWKNNLKKVKFKMWLNKSNSSRMKYFFQDHCFMKQLLQLLWWMDQSELCFHSVEFNKKSQTNKAQYLLQDYSHIDEQVKYEQLMFLSHSANFSSVSFPDFPDHSSHTMWLLAQAPLQQLQSDLYFECY